MSSSTLAFLEEIVLPGPVLSPNLRSPAQPTPLNAKSVAAPCAIKDLLERSRFIVAPRAYSSGPNYPLNEPLNGVAFFAKGLEMASLHAWFPPMELLFRRSGFEPLPNSADKPKGAGNPSPSNSKD